MTDNNDVADLREDDTKLVGVKYATVRQLGRWAVVDVRCEAYDTPANYKAGIGEKGQKFRTYALWYNVVNLSNGQVTCLGKAVLEEHPYDQTLTVVGYDYDGQIPNLKEAISDFADYFLKIEALPDERVTEPPKHRLSNNTFVTAFEVGEESLNHKPDTAITPPWRHA